MFLRCNYLQIFRSIVPLDPVLVVDVILTPILHEVEAILGNGYETVNTNLELVSADDFVSVVSPVVIGRWTV